MQSNKGQFPKKRDYFPGKRDQDIPSDAGGENEKRQQALQELGLLDEDTDQVRISRKTQRQRQLAAPLTVLPLLVPEHGLQDSQAYLLTRAEVRRVRKSAAHFQD